jgi:hypothetical protein
MSVTPSTALNPSTVLPVSTNGSEAGRSLQEPVQKVIDFLTSPLAIAGCTTLGAAGGGALAAGLFTAVNPLGGALFGFTLGATHFATTYAADAISNHFGSDPDNMVSRIVKATAPVIAASAAVFIAGFTLTELGFAVIALGTLGGGILGVGLGFAVLVGGILAYKAYQNIPQTTWNPPTNANPTAVLV